MTFKFSVTIALLLGMTTVAIAATLPTVDSAIACTTSDPPPTTKKGGKG